MLYFRYLRASYCGKLLAGFRRYLGGALIESTVTPSAVGAPMQIEHLLDELIKAGWDVLESDFDPAAFQRWRTKAYECLSAMFGPDHIYTKYFEHFVENGGKRNVLAAGGVLVAAKEQSMRRLGRSSPWDKSRDSRAQPEKEIAR
jgi:hypothetical protein